MLNSTEFTCGVGEYLFYHFETHAQSCKTCPSTRFHNSWSQIAPHRKSYCEEKIMCGPGELYLPDTNTCEPCPVATYRSNSSHQSTSCEPCPVGTYTTQNTVGNTDEDSHCDGIVECGPGEYFIAANAPPPGTYLSTLNQR